MEDLLMECADTEKPSHRRQFLLKRTGRRSTCYIKKPEEPDEPNYRSRKRSERETKLRNAKELDGVN
jgi:hypothetical protein